MIYALVNVTVLLPPKKIFVKLTRSDCLRKRVFLKTTCLSISLFD